MCPACSMYKTTAYLYSTSSSQHSQTQPYRHPTTTSQAADMAAISNHMIEDDIHKEAKPYIWRGPVLPELPISNAKFEEKPLNLTDVRTLAEEDKPKVDTHGFTFVNHKSKTVADVHNDNDAAPYVDEMVEFLKEFLGVETVIGFNARVR